MRTEELSGRVIVIIGASRGIGKATASLLEKQGSKLALGARDISSLKNQFLRDDVLVHEIDVRNEESVKEFIEKVLEKFGGIDVLINAAGIGTFGNLLDSETEDFDNMLAVNLRGTYLTCKYVGRQMRKQKQGQILNLVSIAGTTALAGNGGYSASKFGVLGLTRVLQAELRREGIRITSVIPGAVNSSFWDELNVDLDTNNMIPVLSIAEYIVFLLSQPKQSVVDEITIMPPAGIL